MGEAETLYGLAALLYLIESWVHVPVDAAPFVRVARRWRVARPMVLRGGRGPAFVLAVPWPPLGLLAIGRRGGRLAAADGAAEVARFARATRSLRLLVNVLFVWTFGGGAVLVWWQPAWAVPVFAGIGAAWLGVVVEAARVWRGQAPAVRAPGGALCVALSSPLSAMRAHDVLGKRVVADVDGLALAAVLLPAGERAAAFRDWLARARFQGDGDYDALAALAAAAGVDCEAALRAPERESARALSYCPICRGQFVWRTGSCKSCRGVALLPID